MLSPFCWWCYGGHHRRGYKRYLSLLLLFSRFVVGLPLIYLFLSGRCACVRASIMSSVCLPRFLFSCLLSTQQEQQKNEKKLPPGDGYISSLSRQPTNGNTHTTHAHTPHTTHAHTYEKETDRERSEFETIVCRVTENSVFCMSSRTHVQRPLVCVWCVCVCAPVSFF